MSGLYEMAQNENAEFDANEPEFVSQWATISWVSKNRHWRFSVPDSILQKAIEDGDVIKRENNYRETELEACIELRNQVLTKNEEELSVLLVNRLEDEDEDTRPPLSKFNNGYATKLERPVNRPIAETMHLPKSTVHYDTLLELTSVADGPNILIADVECTPLIVMTYRRFNVNIGVNQILRDWGLLSFSYKWIHEDNVHFQSVKDFTEAELAGQLFELLCHADWVVAHNGKRYDKKRINSILDRHDYPAPTDYKLVDTYVIAKRHFDHTSRALDYLSKEYGGAGKVENGGLYQLWQLCEANAPGSWETLQMYNDVDVIELERIYMRLRAWDDRGPNWALYSQHRGPMCMTCGHRQLSYVGKYRTSTMSYDEFRCLNPKCRKLQRDRKNQEPRDKHRFQNVVL